MAAPKSPAQKGSSVASSIKTSYLGLYNLVQFGLWLTILTYTVKIQVEHPKNNLGLLWAKPGKFVKFAVFLSWMEVVHVAIGLSRGTIPTAFIQTFGRWFIQFALLNTFQVSRNCPWVPHLFLAWSSIEIIRYPYYLLNDFAGGAPQWLTWLRYTAFIPLYPYGMAAEWEICKASAQVVKQAVASRRLYCLPCPGKTDINLFNFYYFLLFGMYFLYPVGGGGLYLYMFKQRAKRLDGKAEKPAAAAGGREDGGPRTRSSSAKSRKAD